MFVGSLSLLLLAERLLFRLLTLLQVLLQQQCKIVADEGKK
jgi:hypothetical protein